MATRETQYTGVRLPPDIKRRVRILAAERGLSTAVMAAKLIEIGADAFLAGEHIDREAGAIQPNEAS